MAYLARKHFHTHHDEAAKLLTEMGFTHVESVSTCSCWSLIHTAGKIIGSRQYFFELNEPPLTKAEVYHQIYQQGFDFGYRSGTEDVVNNLTKQLKELATSHVKKSTHEPTY